MARSQNTSPLSAARPSSPDSGVPDVSLQQLREGDTQAFETLFRRYYDVLYNLAYLYVRSRETAEELVQDVFCRMWERRATLPEPTSDRGIEAVLSYLYRAVRNSALNWLRHQRVETRLSLMVGDDLQAPAMGTSPVSADAAVQSEEVRNLIVHAVARLSEPYREVLALRLDHQMSHSEIAALLQIPLKTVESRITRAFRTLRDALAGLR